MDLFCHTKPTLNHSVTRKPLDCKNNGSYMTVIKLLSKDLSKCRKPLDCKNNGSYMTVIKLLSKDLSKCRKLA